MLAILSMTTVPASAVTASPVWVFFRDRGALAEPGPARDRALAVAASRVTPRALERRARRGAPGAPGLDDRDLDPDPAYVAAIAALGGSIRTTSGWLNAVSVEAPAESLPRIEALPFVQRVRPVAQGLQEQTPDTLADLQDSGPSFLPLDMLHIPEVHAMGDHGEGVVICVLDSGFQLEHESLRQLEVRGQHDFVNGDDDTSYDPRTDLPSQPSHGTAVLSVLAGYLPGSLIGPAYRSEFLLGKSERIGSELPVEEDYWCAGVEWAEAEGADVLTSSLTYHLWYHWKDLDGRTSPSTRAANLALERGLLIVNAIGNEGPHEGSIGAPADAPGVISVGAVNGIGNLTGFSSTGPTYDRRVKPDVVALGSAVWTAQARTWDRYVRQSGTSFSAPLVAGCAALVLSRHPDWSVEEVRDALTMSASRADRPDNEYGWGIVNARDAVLYPLIDGRVTDSITREPVNRAVVRWSSGADTGRVETDSSGAYVIPNLPRGSYTITVVKPGYDDASEGPYDVPPGLGDVDVPLRYRGK
jgi:subtilisin family serine protease